MTKAKRICFQDHHILTKDGSTVSLRADSISTETAMAERVNLVVTEGKTGTSLSPTVGQLRRGNPKQKAPWGPVPVQERSPTGQ